MLPLSSAHFERDQVASLRAAGFVIDGDLKISPVTRKIVGTDEEHRFVVGSPQLQGRIVGDDGQYGGWRM